MSQSHYLSLKKLKAESHQKNKTKNDKSWVIEMHKFKRKFGHLESCNNKYKLLFVILCWYISLEWVLIPKQKSRLPKSSHFLPEWQLFWDEYINVWATDLFLSPVWLTLLHQPSAPSLPLQPPPIYLQPWCPPQSAVCPTKLSPAVSHTSTLSPGGGETEQEGKWETMVTSGWTSDRPSYILIHYNTCLVWK